MDARALSVHGRKSQPTRPASKINPDRGPDHSDRPKVKVLRAQQVASNGRRCSGMPHRVTLQLEVQTEATSPRRHPRGG
jgi:hypothetical protein